MELLIAEHAGFCVGVERAYRLALETAKEGSPVYILGLLVHNAEVIRKLEELGIKSIKDLSEISPGAYGYLIISAHGVSPKLFEEVKKTGLKIIDTTCPWVKKPQKLAKELYEQGYHVIIIGDKNHTEVKGIQGWAEDKAQVLESIKDIDQVSFHEKIGVIAQTTQSLENFEAVVSGLKAKTNELKICDTICEATSKMQSSAVDVAKKVDVMLVVGDKKSANTKRLYELCKRQTETYHIQSASELNSEWFKGKSKIGLTAGASTPDWIIQEVIDKLKLQ